MEAGDDAKLYEEIHNMEKKNYIFFPDLNIETSKFIMKLGDHKFKADTKLISALRIIKSWNLLSQDVMQPRILPDSTKSYYMVNKAI